jgi:hypothetical protein
MGGATEKVQLNLRVDPEVVRVLNAAAVLERSKGKPAAKARLVSAAILAAYSGEGSGDWLPVHHGKLREGTDRLSNAELLDLVDDLEAADE